MGTTRSPNAATWRGSGRGARRGLNTRQAAGLPAIVNPVTVAMEIRSFVVARPAGYARRRRFDLRQLLYDPFAFNLRDSR